MRYRVSRLFWVGLAISPVISLSAVHTGLSQPALTAVSSGFGSLVAFAAALVHGVFPGSSAPISALGLLRKSALRSPPTDLPDASIRRAMISVALRSGTPEDISEPPSRKSAMVRMIRRSMDAANRNNVDSLTDAETIEIVLLKRLMHATSEQAGALAQLFERPDVVLDLRDEFKMLSALRDAFDRDKAALAATQAMWRSGQHRFTDMPEACLEMASPDLDLWHQIVLADPCATRALWCVTQPECDRASVALYMAEVARSDRLEKAIAAGDKTYVQTIRAILKRWCAGGYTNRDLTLTPEMMGGDPTSAMTQLLNRIATQLQEPRWDEPCGLFAPHEGRLPRDRSHWDLKHAQLMRAPSSTAYLEMHLF